LKVFPLYISLLPCFLFGGNLDVLQSFKHLFKEGKILQMPIEFVQIQENQSYKSQGDFLFFSQDQYQFESSEQSIYFHQDTVWTMNHGSQQIIIDQLLSDEFSFFNILLGQFEGIEFLDPIIEKGIFRYAFNISDWDLRGDLILYTNGNPKRIELYIDEKQSTSIEIGKLSYPKSKQFNVEFPETWEVIDLRE
jgi:hypothetical protein